jgi:hypothetical protein
MHEEMAVVGVDRVMWRACKGEGGTEKKTGIPRVTGGGKIVAPRGNSSYTNKVLF